MGSDLLLETYLKQLRLPTVAGNYRRFAQEAAQGNQPYERYLLALLETEVHHRQANSEGKRILQASFQPALRGPMGTAGLRFVSRAQVCLG